MLSSVASMMSKISKVSASKEGRVYWGGWETIQQKQCDQWFCSVASSSFATAWTAAHQASLSFTISRSLLRLMSTESVMTSNHLVLCHPLLLLPSVFLSIAGCLTLNPSEHFMSLFHWGGESILQTGVQTSI